MAEILVREFTVQRAIYTVPQFNHQSPLGGFPLIDCHYMPCNWASEMTPGSRDLAFWGMTFIPSYCAATLLLDPDGNISSISAELSPLLDG